MSKQAKVLTKEEFKRVVAVIKNNAHANRNLAAFYLSFYAGLRVCEIASLTLADVVDTNNKVKAQIVLEKHMTKGSKRNVVFISNALQKLLQQYVDTDCANKSLTTAFIASQKRNAFSALTLSQLFARIYKKANVVNASSHSGRRTFITTLADNAVNVRVIQALARHSSLNTTMRYIDITQTKLESAVEHFKI